jgi:outer membrane protein TolC
MGVFSMPLYEGGATNRKKALARKRIDIASSSAQSLEQRIRNEIQLARNTVSEALARLKLAKGNTEKARRNVAMIKKRYGQGRTILIDLLQAERILLEARNEELAANSVLQKGLADLTYAQGVTSTMATTQELKL